MHAICPPVPVARPALEIADIVRAHLKQHGQFGWFTPLRLKVANALVNCRTAALGGFVARCDHCGTTTVQYASCRNRHCPKCQTLKQTRWVEQQSSRLLDIDYWHLVFTLPHDLNPVAQGHPRLIYNLLFKAASQTLLEFGHNPCWIGGEIGVTMVLHTWGQNLNQHIHVHAVVTGGALSADGKRWLPARNGFLFPTRALSIVFRGKYLELLATAHRDGELQLPGEADAFARLDTALRTNDWVVYAKPPFAGARQVLAYLGRYTHKIAISNHRLVDFDGQYVRFRWRDYADRNRQKTMRLHADEFIRRFLLHVLPFRFTRIRHYGLLSNRDRNKKLAACRALLGQDQPQTPQPETPPIMMLRLTGIDITKCPCCKQGILVQIGTLNPLSRVSIPMVRAPP